MPKITSNHQNLQNHRAVLHFTCFYRSKPVNLQNVVIEASCHNVAVLMLNCSSCVSYLPEGSSKRVDSGISHVLQDLHSSFIYCYSEGIRIPWHFSTTLTFNHFPSHGQPSLKLEIEMFTKSKDSCLQVVPTPHFLPGLVPGSTHPTVTPSPIKRGSTFDWDGSNLTSRRI